MKSLPKAYIHDPDIHEKVRGMLRRYNDAQISDYTGMAIQQVQAIRRSTRVGQRGRPAFLELPERGQGTSEESLRRHDAIVGSAMLLERIEAVYGRRGA